jgi:hypothetical protein
MRHHSPLIPAAWIGWLVLGASLAAIGCGGASYGTVSGKVIYKNATLMGGNVSFLNDEKKVSSVAEIREDGSYKVEKVPVGNVTITVDTSSFKPPPVPRNFKPPAGVQAPSGYDMGERAKRYVPIPNHYADPKQSSLKYTVKGGSQEHDLKLD